MDYLSNNHRKFDLICMIFAYSFDLCPFLGVLLYRPLVWEHAGCLLSGVERCPLFLGGFMCFFCRKISESMGFVHCTKVVCFSEGFAIRGLKHCNAKLLFKVSATLAAAATHQCLV